MAEIERKVQKVFAGGVSPSGNIAIYGSKLAGTVNYSSDIDAIQNARWLTGLFGAISPDKAPYVQDLNAIFYVLSKQLAYLFQAGIAEWQTDTEYFAGRSVVLKSGNIYIATADSTGVEPEVTSGWENSWIKLLNFFLKGISYSDLPSSVFGNYKKGDRINYKDEYGNPITIRALKDNPLAPSEANVYYVKSKLKITEIVTAFPSSPTSDMLGNIYYNSVTNEVKKVIGYAGFSLISFVELTVGNFNTFLDDNGVYYDYNGTAATDIANNYDWVVEDIYIKQQKKSKDFWYIIWSNGIVEQGGYFSVTVPTSSMTFAHGYLEVKLYAEENNSFAGIIEKRATTDNYKCGASVDGFTISTVTVDGVTHRFVTQLLFSAGNIDGSSTTHHPEVTWYLKGIISPIKNIR